MEVRISDTRRIQEIRFEKEKMLIKYLTSGYDTMYKINIEKIFSSLLVLIHSHSHGKKEKNEKRI